MIICEYSKISEYKRVLSKLENALQCVDELKNIGFEVGRYEFEGGFLFIQKGTTALFENGKYEAHKKYIDVQYLISGEEYVYYTSIEKLEQVTEYDTEKDISFYQQNTDKGNVVNIKEGMCWIAFPDDGHMPCRCVDEATDYLKIIIKLPYRCKR